MSDSFTLTLTGTSSILEAHYFPAIELSSEKKYVLGLVDLFTFNSIPNIDEGKNKFYVGKHVITIPPGSYEISDIEKHLEKYLFEKQISISLIPNENTLCSEIECSEEINFIPEDSIGQLLGFTPRILAASTTHISDLPVAILSINSLRVECNITMGAYSNERKLHTIHEFFPVVPAGYKIIEKPQSIIYLPITARTVDHLELRIVDQDGNLVNFRGETITIRLHVKSL